MILKLISFLIFLWQKTSLIRSALNFSSCRFYPSCSHYSLRAFNEYGFLNGFFLSLKRILKCNPFFQGGIDYVPGIKK